MSFVTESQALVLHLHISTRPANEENGVFIKSTNVIQVCCALMLFCISPSLLAAQGLFLLNLANAEEVETPSKADAPPLVKKVEEHSRGRFGAGQQDLIERVAGLYRQFLEREPDVPGLTYYVDRVANEGMTIDEVSRAITRSPEYRALHPEQPASANATYERLKPIADNLAGSTARACYRTAVATAARNGGINDGWAWSTTTAYRGRSLSSLAGAIDDGTLRGGMVIYMNTAPGRDRASLNLSYRPHWMTYLGRDGSGVPRFSDQYGTSYSVEQVAASYAPRVIDAFFNPYSRN